MMKIILIPKFLIRGLVGLQKGIVLLSYSLYIAEKAR